MECTGFWRNSYCGTHDLSHSFPLQVRDFTVQTLYQGKDCPGPLKACKVIPRENQQLPATKKADLLTWRIGIPSLDSRIPGCHVRSSCTFLLKSIPDLGKEDRWGHPPRACTWSPAYSNCKKYLLVQMPPEP